MFIGTSTGIVSATTRPPSAAARSAADSWRGTRSGTRESTVSTFQLSGRAAAADMRANRSISASENWSRQPSMMPSSVVPSWRSTAAHSASTSASLAHRDATGWPSPSEWVLDSVVEKPSPPASIAVSSSRTIACDLVVGRLAADRVGAHHVAAQRAVPDQEPGVDRDPALEPAEVLAEGLPVPVDALLQRGERHALDLGHHPAQVVGVLGVQRREREAAVAADDGGDAVHVARRRARVPEQLRVVVGVRVDEPGRQDEVGAVDRARGGVVDVADRDDAPVGHRDVGHPARRTRAVDHRRPPNDQIRHVPTPSHRRLVADPTAPRDRLRADAPSPARRRTIAECPRRRPSTSEFAAPARGRRRRKRCPSDGRCRRPTVGDDAPTDQPRCSGFGLRCRGRQSICWPPVASSRRSATRSTPPLRPGRRGPSASGRRRGGTRRRARARGTAPARRRSARTSPGSPGGRAPRPARAPCRGRAATRAASRNGSANVAVGRNRYQLRSWNTPGGRLSQSSIQSHGRSSRLFQNGNIGASGGSSSPMRRQRLGSGDVGHRPRVVRRARRRRRRRPTPSPRGPGARPGSSRPRATRRASCAGASGPTSSTGANSATPRKCAVNDAGRVSSVAPPGRPQRDRGEVAAVRSPDLPVARQRDRAAVGRRR